MTHPPPSHAGVFEAQPQELGDNGGGYIVAMQGCISVVA
jgi:hypothetical protein